MKIFGKEIFGKKAAPEAGAVAPLMTPRTVDDRMGDIKAIRNRQVEASGQAQSGTGVSTPTEEPSLPEPFVTPLVIPIKEVNTSPTMVSPTTEVNTSPLETPPVVPKTPPKK